MRIKKKKIKKKKLPRYNYCAPENILQGEIRKIITKLTSNIKVPHCVICGDTNEDGVLKCVLVENNKVNFCETCYNFQIGF